MPSLTQDWPAERTTSVAVTATMPPSAVWRKKSRRVPPAGGGCGFIGLAMYRQKIVRPGRLSLAFLGQSLAFIAKAKAMRDLRPVLWDQRVVDYGLRMAVLSKFL